MSESWFDFDLLESGGFGLRTLKAGEKLFLAGEEGDEMYIVKSGKVHIVASGVVVENVGPQGIFGEMAMIDGSPRSATAIAAEDTALAPVDRTTFLYMVKQNPEFALQVLQMLTARIRQMNEYI